MEHSSCSIASSFKPAGSGCSHFDTELTANVGISNRHGRFNCDSVRRHEISSAGHTSFCATWASIEWQLADWRSQFQTMGIGYFERQDERAPRCLYNVTTINGSMLSWMHLGSQRGFERGLRGVGNWEKKRQDNVGIFNAASTYRTCVVLSMNSFLSAKTKR